MAGGSDEYARERVRQAKERERRRKAADAEAKRKAREEKVAHEAARAQEAVDKTSVTEHDVEQLAGLLLRLNSWCRVVVQAGLMVRPVSARQPSMRSLR
ncbi:hypothetical protein, partial [Streptomyces sp. NPDC054901]